MYINGGGKEKLLKLLGQLGKSYSHLVKSYGGFIESQPIIVLHILLLLFFFPPRKGERITSLS